MLNLEIKTD